MGAFPDEVDAAQSVVITGPSMTGEGLLFHRLLAARGNDRIVIATGQTADAFRSDHTGLDEDSTVRVIDCVTSEQGETPPEDDVTRYVDGPGNLTALGEKVSEFLSLASENSVVVGVNSLQELLSHAGVEQTQQFLHILAQQTAADDIPLVATLHERAHDDQVVDTIRAHFQCSLETRRVDEGTEYRVRTPTTEPSSWMAVEHAE